MANHMSIGSGIQLTCKSQLTDNQAYKLNPQEYSKLQKTLDYSCGDPFLKLKSNYMSPTADLADKRIEFEKNKKQTLKNIMHFPILQRKMKEKLSDNLRSRSTLDIQSSTMAANRSKMYIREKRIKAE